MGMVEGSPLPPTRLIPPRKGHLTRWSGEELTNKFIGGTDQPQLVAAFENGSQVGMPVSPTFPIPDVRLEAPIRIVMKVAFEGKQMSFLHTQGRHSSHQV